MEPNNQSNAPVDDLPLTITRAVESVERGEPVPAAPTTDTSRPVAAPPATVEGGTQSGLPLGDQPRDGSGRFSTKPAPTAPAAVPPPPVADNNAATAVPAPQEAPASWKDDARTKWASVAPEIRTEVHRREREIDRAMTFSAERAKAASTILDEFAPYAEILQAENTPPAAAIRTLLQTVYALRTSGPEYRKSIFLDLAQQYGVDLTSGINPEQAHAEARASQYEIDGRTQRAYQEAQQQEHANVMISQFASTHEHFPVLREIMGNLLGTGVCPDLETAYQQAMVLSPQMRPLLIQQEVDRRAQDDARRRAASSSVTGGPGGFSSGPSGAPGDAPNPRDDLRGSISAALERVGVR